RSSCPCWPGRFRLCWPSVDPHLDVALELGTIGDDDARRLDVADHLAFLAHFDALGGGHVADQHAADGQVLGRNAGLDLARAVDGEVAARDDLALDAPLNDEILFAFDLPFDLHRRAEYSRGLVAVHEGSLSVKREVRLDAARELDVHFDGATEPRALGHDDAGSFDVPHDLGIGCNLDAIGRAGVAVHLTLDGHVLHLDVGGDDGGALED